MAKMSVACALQLEARCSEWANTANASFQPGVALKMPEETTMANATRLTSFLRLISKLLTADALALQCPKGIDASVDSK